MWLLISQASVLLLLIVRIGDLIKHLTRSSNLLCSRHESFLQSAQCDPLGTYAWVNITCRPKIYKNLVFVSNTLLINNAVLTVFRGFCSISDRVMPLICVFGPVCPGRIKRPFTRFTAQKEQD